MITNKSNNWFKGFSNTTKKYKDKCLLPEETCDKIYEILKTFFEDTKFNFYHESLRCPFSNIWSTVNFINYDTTPFLIVGGKGISLELAKASGYGELMERLQVGYFFSSNSFRERLVPKYNENISFDIIKLNQNFRQKARELNNPYLPKWNDRRKKYVPFLNAYNMEEVLIDDIFLIDGTGYASGNSYEEAFTQALCEVFERYSALKIVLNKIECPNIPIERISKYNKGVIEEIEQAGINITIKDFSLNKGIPVVGILYNYRDFGELELKVGSATSIDVAVERCLTEFMQIMGLSILKKKISSSKLSKIIPIHLSRIREHFVKARSLYKKFPYIEHYLPFHAFISLRFPRHYFYPSEDLSFLTCNSGIYKKWSYYNKNCFEEVKLLLQSCKKIHLNVFMKEFSWLGFPTLKVFVPELYFGHNEYKDYINPRIHEFSKKLLKDIYSITVEDLKLLTSPEFLIYCCLNNNLTSFFKIKYRKKDFFNVWKFFGLLAFALGEKQTAKLLLKQYFKYGIDSNMNDFNSLKNKPEILQYLKNHLPNCFYSCEKCYFSVDCRYFHLKELEKKISRNVPELFTMEPPKK